MTQDLLDMIQDLGEMHAKSAAADSPTSHPSGSADNGEQPATTGEFASTNESDAKENQGPAGVDSAKTDPPAKTKEPNDPAQEELNPGTTDDPPPGEIKPTKTVESAGTDSDTTGTDTELENKAAATQGNLQALLTEMTAIVPIVEKPAAEGNIDGGAAAPVVTEPKTEVTPAADPPADAPADPPAEAPAEVAKDAAEKMLAVEKFASDTIKTILTAKGIAADAEVNVKLAALTAHYVHIGQRAVDGFVLSTDTEKLASILKVSQDVMEAPTSPDQAAPPAPAPEMAPPAPGAPPAGDPAAGGGGEDIEQKLQALLEMVARGEITVDQLLEQLRAEGVPEEIIQMIAQQVQSMGGAGGEGAPPEAAPAPMPEDTGAADAAASEAEKPASNATIKAAVAGVANIIKAAAQPK